MSAADDVLKAVAAGDAPQAARLVAALDDTARRAVAKDLPGELKRLRAAATFPSLDRRVVDAFLVAGAGAIGGAAAAAAWLCRSDLRPWWTRDAAVALSALLGEATSARPAEWRAEVAQRVAARVRATDDEWARWHMAAALARSSGGAPPLSDGFVIGWVADGVAPDELADDPFLDALVPKLFEVDGAGGAVLRQSFRGRWDTDRGQKWADALAALARAGRLDRAALLDGCVSRFLRGGTPYELRWFVRLHEALEPTEEEAVARVRDHVRLLATAPPTVAGLALGEVRRVDDLERLDAALFDEAAGAVLFRTEKKLVRTALTWLDRTARKRDRVDATLRAVAVVFACDDLDLRERAVKIAVKHAARAGDTVRDEVRNAAADLPDGPRASIAAAFGEVATAAAPAPLTTPPPFTPREFPAPIGSLRELADEFADLAHFPEHWPRTERFLAALIEFAHRDIDATREALRKPAPAQVRDDIGDASWYETARGPIGVAVRGLFEPRRGLVDAVAGFVREKANSRRRSEPRLSRLVMLRAREAASAIGRAPVLLSTPTEGSGHIDPDVLVDRLERVEAAGLEPGEVDVLQAKLRVPRAIDPATVARAKALRSRAGREMAAWLAGGGLPDPAVECRLLDEPIKFPGGGFPARVHVLTSADIPENPDIARVCSLSTPEPPQQGWWYGASMAAWASVLPSHRELTAAHMLPHLVGTEQYGWGQGDRALDLAEADGPAGAATGTLLACALVNRSPEERANAVEAFLAFSGRGHLPAAETGAALGRLTALGRVTLSRAVRSLTSAADAGAHADVWATAAAALPHVLPAPGERAATGVPALLALATRVAETTGARGAIPAVADVATRGGSSRLARESARLHHTLAT